MNTISVIFMVTSSSLVPDFRSDTRVGLIQRGGHDILVRIMSSGLDADLSIRRKGKSASGILSNNVSTSMGLSTWIRALPNMDSTSLFFSTSSSYSANLSRTTSEFFLNDLYGSCEILRSPHFLTTPFLELQLGHWIFFLAFSRIFFLKPFFVKYCMFGFLSFSLNMVLSTSFKSTPPHDLQIV